MAEIDNHQNSKQKVYREIILGTLLYSVVLGFFNDYTHILHTGTYSVTFAVALVMEILTYLTFRVKDGVMGWFAKREGNVYKYGMFFSVWLVLFLSKFVFLEVIAFVFRNEVKISGFLGLMVIVVCLTVAERIVSLVDQKLG